MALSISALAYDGHPFEAACESIAEAGGTHVEPAFIESYGPVPDSLLTDRHAGQLARSAAQAGLKIQSISLHVDPQSDDAVEKLDRRLGFGALVGARFVLTNIARPADEAMFRRRVETLARRAQAHGVKLCFENPGDARSLVSSGAEAIRWEAEIGCEHVGINLDVGNLHTVDPDALLPAQTLRRAIGVVSHVHLKDFLDQSSFRRAVAIGEGVIDYRSVLAEIALRGPDFPIGIEMPLRVRRSTSDSSTTRDPPFPLAQVDAVVRRSLDFVNRTVSAGCHST